MNKKNFFIMGCLLSLILTSCETTKSVPSEIAEKYPLLPIEEIIESSRTQQELMSDIRQYFEDIGSSLYKETDISLISTGVVIGLGEEWMKDVETYCTFKVNTEFKDNGDIRRIRLRTMDVKYSIGEHNTMIEVYGVSDEKELRLRKIAGEKYNKFVKELRETIHRIAQGKTEYTW